MLYPSTNIVLMLRSIVETFKAYTSIYYAVKSY